MGSIVDSSDIQTLTAFERIGPKGWIRYVFLFELAEDYDLQQVADVARCGLHAVKQRFPEAGCEAVPDLGIKQQGVFKLQELKEEEIASLITKDLRHSDDFPQSYSELKANGFPVSAFDADLLCRGSVWAAPGDRVPISLVQANFIRGGLILTWNIFHMIGDAVCFATWMKVWSEGCRRAQGLNIPDPIQLSSALWTDREQVKKPSGTNQGRLADHPEYTLLPFSPTGAPPKMLSPHHRGQIFYFSPEALKMLKSEASPANTTEVSDQKWVSTMDAVSALLWRTVMAVQSPLESLEGDPVSNFGIALDARQRVTPKIHPSTLGCFLAYASVEESIRNIVGKLNLADLAVLVRKAVLRANDQFGDDVVTLVDSLDDVNTLVPTAFLDVPGSNCVQTSWLGFDLYSLDWGPLLCNKVDAVRTPSVGIINGLQVILPMLPDGGMEVMMGVEESCLDRLLSDPLLNKYAVAR